MKPARPSRIAFLAAAVAALALPNASLAAHRAHHAIVPAVTAHGHHRMLGVIYSALAGHGAKPTARHGRGAHAASELAGGPPADNTENLTYHGGPVMHANTTYTIYWLPGGSTISAAYESTINGFFANVAAASGATTNVYATDTQYSDGSGAIAYNSTYGGTYVDTTTPIPNDCSSEYGSIPVHGCVTDADIQAEAERAITATGWTPTSSSIFFVFTPKDVGSCFSGDSTACAYTYYCAYHSAFTDGHGRTIFYTNQPYPDTSDLGTGQVCDAGQHPNGDVADATINVASHEHNETITDPLGTAWWDASGNEIGDKCAWNFGSSEGSTQTGQYNQEINGGHYYLQQEWSNASVGCVQSYAPPSTSVPTLTSISPNQATVGSSVTITGTNLTGATAVRFNGVSATYTVNSATSISATVPANSTSGTVMVTTPGGTADSPSGFTVIYPPPTVTSFSPTSAAALTVITINGTGLAEATSVKFDGQPCAFAASSATQMIAMVPPTAGSGPIAVTTPAGTFTTKASFVVLPTGKSLAPNWGVAATSVTVSGYNLLGATGVRFNGIAAPYTVTSAESITAEVPNTATSGNVTVTTPTGTVTVGSFTVHPSVSSLSVSKGKAGTLLAINGANFTGVTSVDIGGVQQPSMSVRSATQITTTIAPTTPSGAIAVTVPGASTLADTTPVFTVIPTVTGFSPASGAPGATVAISGENFYGVSSVTFGGISATYTVNSWGSISAKVPAGALTGTIAVDNPGGDGVSAKAFTVTPAIADLSVSSGKAGASVAINGTNLGGATAVRFNGVTATFRVVSASEITATVPSKATSGYVTVVTAAGTATSPGSFTVGSPASAKSRTSAAASARRR